MIHRDETYYDGDDEPHCFNCYHRYVSHRAIHDYYYKPIPEFYGDDSRFLGVELEVDCAGEDDESAETVMYIANGSNELMAHSNFRAMPICVEIGEAAGAAAVIASENNISLNDVTAESIRESSTLNCKKHEQNARVFLMKLITCQFFKYVDFLCVISSGSIFR